MKVLGQGAVNIAGHKISYTLLAAVAGIAGAILLVLQMRRGQSSVTAGSPATVYPGADAAGGPSVYGQDFGAYLSAISQQLASITGQNAAQSIGVQPSSAPIAPAPAQAVQPKSGWCDACTRAPVLAAVLPSSRTISDRISGIPLRKGA